MLRVFILSFLYTSLGVSATQFGRTFTKSFQFDDISRWQNGKLPCSKDDIQFDANQRLSLVISTTATINNLYLPLNSEIILEDGFQFGSSKDLSNCDSSKGLAQFLSNPDDWFNAKNWESHNIQDGSPVHVQDFLDTENVPCEQDQVTLAEKSTVTVNIPNDIILNRFTLAGQRYSTETLASYRDGDNGRYEFLGGGQISVVPESCQDATGCFCRNLDYQNIEKTICSKTVCKEASCKKSLRPNGQCCHVCGAVLTMKYGNSYTESKMQTFLNQQTSKYSKTHFALSKRKNSATDSKGYIQIMITDELESIDSGKNAKKLATEINNILKPVTNDYGVSDVTIQMSGDGIEVASSGVSTGLIVGVVVGILVLVALLFVGYRFHGNGGLDLKVSIPTFWKTPTTGETNPMYDMSSSDGGSNNGSVSENKESSTTVGQQVNRDSGLPEALNSDFGVSFPNISYHEEDL